MLRKLKTRKRYRLVFVNDNTLNTVWTLRLTRAKVWTLTALCVSAVAALVFCILVWSPVSYLLPGYLRPEQRVSTVDNILRVDSMLRASEIQSTYLANIVSLLAGEDSVQTFAPDAPAQTTDTLMTASARERAFVDSWLERERGTLSVLSPLVAEGMLFRSPAIGAEVDSNGELIVGRGAPVVAVADGIVVAVIADPNARQTVVVQHSNDFISLTSGLVDATVAPGRRVSVGQLLGRASASGRINSQIFHSGTPYKQPNQ